jgi:hypothetical protein
VPASTDLGFQGKGFLGCRFKDFLHLTVKGHLGVFKFFLTLSLMNGFVQGLGIRVYGLRVCLGFPINHASMAFSNLTLPEVRLVRSFA